MGRSAKGSKLDSIFGGANCSFKTRANEPFTSYEYEYWWVDHRNKPEKWVEYFNKRAEIYLTAEGIVDNIEVVNLLRKNSIGCYIEDFWNFIQTCSNYKENNIKIFAKKIAKAVNEEAPFLESANIYKKVMEADAADFSSKEAKEVLSNVHENGSFLDAVAIIHCLGNYYEPGEINAKALYDIIVSDAWCWFLTTANLKYYESVVKFFKKHLPKEPVATITYSIEDEKWRLSMRYKATI